MVSRKTLLAVVTGVMIAPCAYGMSAEGTAPAPKTSGPTIIDRGVGLVTSPLDFVFDQAWSVFHQDGYAADNAFARYGRAMVKLALMYYIVTNEKTKELALQAKDQTLALTTRVLGIQKKKGVCTKAWSKECGACPKACAATK